MAMHRNDTQPTVLIVDHDVWERRYATDMLANEGYSVVGASNGASGLRIAEQHSCDAIVLDLALPEVTGVEFLQRVKAMDRTREIPVIVLGDWPDIQPVASAGCVPKPLEPTRMMSEVARCLRDVQG
jgi:CheY-like chemotaxis protein